MRSPEAAQRGAAVGDLVAGAGAGDRVAAAALGAFCPFSDASAACTGAPRLRVTARAAVAPNATAAAIRKPRLAPARITGPLAMIKRLRLPI
jgi:hypothetical protein